MMLVPRSVGAIIDGTARDVHPPLYYLLLHFWTLVFGTSIWSVRGFSAVVGILLIPLVYLILKRLFSTKIALYGAFFTAIAPFLIRFSQEVRMYGLVALFATLATYALIRALENQRWRWWIIYTLAVTAAVYTQYYGLLIVAAHVIYVFTLAVMRRGEGRWRALLSYWRFAASLFTAALLFLPWIPILFAQLNRVTGHYWIQQGWITIHTVPSSLYEFSYYDHLDFLLKGYWHEFPALLLLILTVFTYFRYRKQWREVTLLVASFIVPTTLMWTYSKLRSPVYQDRYFPFAAVGFYAMMALWIFTPKKVWLQRALFVFFTVSLLGGTTAMYLETNHQMKQAASIINEQYRPGDEVASLDLYTYFDFHYYNHTGYEAKLYSRGPFTYGEPGLLQGREDLRISYLTEVTSKSGKLWAVSHTGKHTYNNEIPRNWQLLQEAVRGNVLIREYKVPKST